MTTTVAIPQHGWEMQEAVLLEWLVADGDPITAGQPLYVLGTDKVDETIEAPVDGVVRIKGVEGDTYAVGHVIAEIEQG
jgi:pyruvate/2-oxoglutarate dehydrogenase complex dihydrolipoamide acyltransferase (E2) component